MATTNVIVDKSLIYMRYTGKTTSFTPPAIALHLVHQSSAIVFIQ